MPVVKMGAKGSITSGKGYYFLNSQTGLLLILIISYLNNADSLRTRAGHSSGEVSREHAKPQTRSYSHSSKERRLSFLNHHLSLLGGKVGPETRITSKVYTHRGDSETGTVEVGILEVLQNTDLVVGKEIPNGVRVVLECQAEFPVNWVYQGDGAPQLQTNTSVTAKKKAKYSAIAFIGSDEGSLDGKETGEYICRNTQNPEESIRYYIYVPARSYFIRRGGIIKISSNDNALRIPCSVTNPDARVTILKSNKGYLNCVVNDSLSYSSKTGFSMSLVEDDERDVTGIYVCMAGINDSYQLAEYSVIRSYENSTFEYNWDENGMIYDDELSSDVGRKYDEMCIPNPCGSNSVCEPIFNPRTGDPFSCKCKEGYRGKAPRCRKNSLCDSESNPCGPHSSCQEDLKRNYPKCSCLPSYIGRPPNCKPECVLDMDCHPSFNCVNSTCQNPCLKLCSLDAVCTVTNHLAKCSCPLGTAGDPSNGGTCHRIRLPNLNFFPNLLGIRPRPRPRPSPLRLPGGLQQIFPGDSVLSAAFSEEDATSDEIRNPCEPWPCGLYSQCTPVGEYAHCKCNAGYVGLPPNCRPECQRDSDCSSSHACIDNNCKNPCVSRGKIRCGEGAQCRGRHHQAECQCPDGFRGDPSVRCYPSDSGETSGESSQSQESGTGMWGSNGPRPPPPSSGGDSGSAESSEEGHHSGSGKIPTRPPSSKPQRPVQSQKPPRPSNPHQGGRPSKPDKPNNADGSGSSSSSSSSSCASFCGKNAICVKRNNTVSCRCKQGYTGPGSDPYTECAPSRNPCSKCGPNSVCRVMGNGTPLCECQPGKLGSPPNCRDNLCHYNRDCPEDQTCVRRNCVNPCQYAMCGAFSTCKAIEHTAVCACPHDPERDPFEEGCPPPPKEKRPPGYFPPTRFFI